MKCVFYRITDWCQLPLNIVKLNAILNSTLVIRKRGIVVSNTDVNKWRGLLDYSILEAAKCHSNDQVCFQLIIAQFFLIINLLF